MIQWTVIDVTFCELVHTDPPGARKHQGTTSSGCQ